MRRLYSTRSMLCSQRNLLPILPKKNEPTNDTNENTPAKRFMSIIVYITKAVPRVTLIRAAHSLRTDCARVGPSVLFCVNYEVMGNDCTRAVASVAAFVYVSKKSGFSKQLRSTAVALPNISRPPQLTWLPHTFLNLLSFASLVRGKRCYTINNKVQEKLLSYA